MAKGKRQAREPMSMTRGLFSIAFASAGLFAAGPIFSQTPTPAESPASISPDKQWEYYFGDGNSRLVKAGTTEAAVQFDCKTGTFMWAPDSQRFAIACLAKGSTTLVCQLRNGKWETGDNELGNGDEIMDRAAKLIEAKARKKGIPKKTHLHMNRWAVEPEKWIDSRTLVIFAEMWEVAHTDDEKYDHEGFATDLLLTLKFDDSGAWKIIKTRELSEKEVKQRESKAE